MRTKVYPVYVLLFVELLESSDDYSQKSRMLHDQDESDSLSSHSPVIILKTKCTKFVDTFQTDPNNFANILFEQNLISTETLDKVREINETKREKAEKIHSNLLTTVKSAERYSTLISVLKKSKLMCEEFLAELI